MKWHTVVTLVLERQRQEDPSRLHSSASSRQQTMEVDGTASTDTVTDSGLHMHTFMHPCTHGYIKKIRYPWHISSVRLVIKTSCQSLNLKSYVGEPQRMLLLLPGVKVLA